MREQGRRNEKKSKIKRDMGCKKKNNEKGGKIRRERGKGESELGE